MKGNGQPGRSGQPVRQLVVPELDFEPEVTPLAYLALVVTLAQKVAEVK